MKLAFLLFFAFYYHPASLPGPLTIHLMRLITKIFSSLVIVMLSTIGLEIVC